MVFIFLVPFALRWPLAVVLLMKVAGQGCVGGGPRLSGHIVFMNSWQISVIRFVARRMEAGSNGLNEIIKSGEY